MQVEAIYNQGRISSVNLDADVLLRAHELLAQYESILNAPFPSEENLPELSAEYQERLEAIDLREQIRQEQGRPV